MIVSIILPTFNRVDSLDQAIESYVKQTLAPDWHELIIVDNNSNDHTRDVINEWQKRSSVIIKYLFEGRQGEHYARHLGFRESQGELLLNTDDDMSSKSELLTVYQKKFGRNPELVAAKGPINLIWE